MTPVNNSETSGVAARPNVLFVMTDQQRFDTIRALGNEIISTPHLDRLAARGVAFTNAYSTTPVCVPARYTLMSGCDATQTGIYDNSLWQGAHQDVAARCGPYLPSAMGSLGYRTFGVGKFHTTPWDAPLGFDVQLHSEEFYETADQRQGDAYAGWLERTHPEFRWLEALMGERTEMYYMPQMSAMPRELTVEQWATDRALELMAQDDGRPWFGLVSFVGPHPPFAPPLPFNRMYDPDQMPAPASSDRAVDHLDFQIPWMNHAVFADAVDPERAKALKARYYGEISYIDDCIGQLLAAVDASDDGDNTVICFFADHGDLLGDHNGWQKENFFEASTRIPFLLSWPAQVPQGIQSSSLVCLSDLFGVATGAGGQQDIRQGIDVLGATGGRSLERSVLFGCHGIPGSIRFKAMVRRGQYKLVWLANGNISLLFDVDADPGETRPLQNDFPDVTAEMRGELTRHLRAQRVDDAFDGDALFWKEYEKWTPERIYQFDRSRGVSGFPGQTGDVNSSSGAPRLLSRHKG